MSPRTTGIVFLAAVALAAFVYFYEIRGEEGRREAEHAEKQLFPDVRADAVDWITFRSTDGQEGRLERVDEVWELVEPLRFPADAPTADAMAAALAEVVSEAVYEEPQGPEVYGLDDPEREIRFGVADEVYALRLGKATPVGSNTYAGVEGDDRVFAIATYQTNALSKSLADVRDKRIVEFDPASIDRITASWHQGGVVLRREEDGWKLLEPLIGPADPRTVDDLLTDLRFLRATTFLDDPPNDAKVGLDPPQLALTLEGRTENPEEPPIRLRVEIGDTVGATSRMVRSAVDSLYLIPQERLNDFPRELIAYRFKQLAEFPALDAERLEIAFRAPDGEVVTTTARRGEMGWSAAPEDFRPGRLASLVSELSRLRGSAILADSMTEAELEELELAPPNAILRVYGEGEAEAPQLAEIHLGEFRSSAGIVARSSEDPTVYLLPLDLAEHIPVSLEAFRNRFASEEPAAPPADAADPDTAPEDE